MHVFLGRPLSLSLFHRPHPDSHLISRGFFFFFFLQAWWLRKCERISRWKALKKATYSTKSPVWRRKCQNMEIMGEIFRFGLLFRELYHNPLQSSSFDSQKCKNPSYWKILRRVIDGFQHTTYFSFAPNGSNVAIVISDNLLPGLMIIDNFGNFGIYENRIECVNSKHFEIKSGAKVQTETSFWRTRAGERCEHDEPCACTRLRIPRLIVDPCPSHAAPKTRLFPTYRTVFVLFVSARPFPEPYAITAVFLNNGLHFS